MQMRRMQKIFFSLILLLSCTISLGIWGGEKIPIVSASSDTHSVTFDYSMESITTNYGADIRNISNKTIEVVDGECATNPLSEKERENLSTIKSGYSLGWVLLDGGDEISIDDPFNYNIYSNTTFRAKWTPITFTITLIYNDNSTYPAQNKYDSIAYTVEEKQNINFTYGKYIPTREHYKFVSWCNSPLLRDSDLYMYTPAGSSGDFTLYARWSAIQYQIDYHTDADNSRNPSGYSVEDGDITLYAPSKEGHIFKGWYSDSTYTNKIEKISSGTSGKINLYPKWELEKYKVTYILPDGTRTSVMCEYGKKASLPSELKKSIFEVVKTSTSRDNIKGDTRIEITLINIWWVYLIGLILILGIILLIILIKVKREASFNNMRDRFQKNSNKNNYRKK